MFSNKVHKFCILFIFCSIVYSQKTNPGFSKVIYGDDGRMDTYELDEFDTKLTHSTVLIIIGSHVLSHNEDGSYTATSTSTAENFWNFCPDERYSDQLILSKGREFCSGFLISENWIATAAHCSLGNLHDYYVIFDFELLNNNETRLHFTSNEVYFVTDVIALGTPSGDTNDYGILELDRNVVGFTPYSDINHNLSIEDQLTLIGHPVGLPKKTDKGGIVTHVDNSIIRGTVDSYGGNSGSPVFDRNGLLVGILVGGSSDFKNNQCTESNICPGGIGCFPLGEHVVPICVLIESSELVQNRLNISCSNENTIQESSNNDFYSSEELSYTTLNTPISYVESYTTLNTPLSNIESSLLSISSLFSTSTKDSISLPYEILISSNISIILPNVILLTVVLLLNISF